jgi:hypothetical protein
MIAALAITLILECGRPDRLLISEWLEWHEYRVTPISDRGKWVGYQIIAPNWVRNQIKGREIKRIDQCDKKQTQRG